MDILVVTATNALYPLQVRTHAIRYVVICRDVSEGGTERARVYGRTDAGIPFDKTNVKKRGK
jgi:hypothetical protein